MFPGIVLVLSISLAGVAASLVWYGTRTKSGRRQIDEQAVKFARDLFQKSLDQLTPDEARQVQHLTKEFYVE